MATNTHRTNTSSQMPTQQTQSNTNGETSATAKRAAARETLDILEEVGVLLVSASLPLRYRLPFDSTMRPRQCRSTVDATWIGARMVLSLAWAGMLGRRTPETDRMLMWPCLTSSLAEQSNVPITGT